MPARTITPIERYRVPTMADHVAAFLNVKRRMLGLRVERTTIKTYATDLERFLAAFGSLAPADITPAALESFLGGLKRLDGTPLAANTTNRVHGALSGFFSWLTDQGTIATNPMRKVRKTRVPEEAPAALPDSAGEVLVSRARAAGAREYALITLLVETGLRIAEALALDVEDVDLGGFRVMVRHGKGDKARVVFLPQGGRARTALRKLLADRPEQRPHAPVFTTARGRLSYPRAAAIFTSLAEGITNPDGSSLHLHQLRHEFATEQLRRGVNPVHLATMTGHADLRTLARYTKAAQVAAAEAEFRRHNP